MPEERKPDAFKVPAGIARGADITERSYYIRDRFAPIMGAAAVTIFSQGPYLFVARTPADTLYFATEHPRHPEPRYDWSAPDAEGIVTGTYVDGANNAP